MTAAVIPPGPNASALYQHCSQHRVPVPVASTFLAQSGRFRCEEHSHLVPRFDFLARHGSLRQQDCFPEEAVSRFLIGTFASSVSWAVSRLRRCSFYHRRESLFGAGSLGSLSGHFLFPRSVRFSDGSFQGVREQRYAPSCRNLSTFCGSSESSCFLCLVSVRFFDPSPKSHRLGVF